MEYRTIYINGYETHYIIYENGDIMNTKTNRILKVDFGSRPKDYPQVCIFYKDNEGNVKRAYRMVHRLLAEAFIYNPDPENFDQVNHIDGDKRNWNLDNLEWCDQSYNMKHAYDNKLRSGYIGENNPSCKLSDELIINICELYVEGKTTSEIRSIMKEQGIEVSQTYLDKLRRKKARKNITSKYNF